MVRCRIIERRLIRTCTVGASGWTRLGAGASVAAETAPADIRTAPKAAAAIAEAVRRVLVIGAGSLL
ncbi:hypothetical protein FV223_03580 [Methylobacterium sp. WL116]|nr:hypothetical protein FV223_03580 [Methylobacterium sp. WL116]